MNETKKNVKKTNLTNKTTPKSNKSKNISPPRKEIKNNKVNDRTKKSKLITPNKIYKQKPVVTIKKRKYVRKKNKQNIIPHMLIIFIILSLSAIIFYTLFLFPNRLIKSIKNDIIQIYSPLIFEDSDAIMIFKLRSSPNMNQQDQLTKHINNSYGLDTKFEKIADLDGKGINKIHFYKNNKIFSGLNEVYIYWDEKQQIIDEIKEIFKDNKKDDSIKVITKQKNSSKFDNYNKENLKKELSQNKATIRVNEKKNNISRDSKTKEQNEIKRFVESKKIEKDKSHNISTNQYVKPLQKEKDEDVNLSQISIIIDDVGYSYSSTDKFLSLGIPITFAIIPQMPQSKRYYDILTKNNYETIVHIPMEPQKGKEFVEPNALLTGMSEEQIRNSVNKFLRQFPSAVGANNHMGSKAVTDGKLMNALISELSAQNKIWIDSMTNINSISKEITAIYKMPYYRRNVFLDNQKDKTSIRKSMDELVKEARQNGYAIGIGHAQTENLPEIIEEYYNKRNLLGIKFVKVSKINTKNKKKY